MRVEEEYDKLVEAMKGKERSIRQVIELDWAKSKGMRYFYDGMLHECSYSLMLLKIWKPRILGEEENVDELC